MSSENGRSLAHRELSRWSPGDDLLPYLNVGIGCHICIITKDNKTVFARRRVPLRRKQYDVGAVEGLAPYLDKLWMVADENGLSSPTDWVSAPSQQFDLKNFFLRAVQEEFHLDEIQISEMNCFGIGCDLFYSQWNFTGSAYLNLTFAELEKLWPKAISRDEIFQVSECEFNVEQVEKKIQDEVFWSSGVACLLYALRFHYKKKGLHFPYDAPYNRLFRMSNESQYFLAQ